MLLLESLAAQPIQNPSQLTADVIRIYKVLYKTVSNQMDSPSNFTLSLLIEPVARVFKAKPLVWTGTIWTKASPTVIWKDRRSIFGNDLWLFQS